MASDGHLEVSGDDHGTKTADVHDRELIFKPGAGRLPSPEALAKYAEIDPSYPQSLMESFQLELKRNYRYQVCALVAGWTFALSLAVEAGMLTARGHEKVALILIGANALGLATRMLTKAASRD